VIYIARSWLTKLMRDIHWEMFCQNGHLENLETNGKPKVGCNLGKQMKVVKYYIKWCGTELRFEPSGFDFRRVRQCFVFVSNIH
jgi:hypothetical protein